MVDEIVVFACAHARAIEAHLRGRGLDEADECPSGASSSSAPASAASPQRGGGAASILPVVSRGPRVSVAVSTAAASVGDALRALEQSDRLTSDFVLVSADVVANVDLKEAVRAHRERRSSDRSAIATLLVRGGVTREQRLRLGEARWSTWWTRARCVCSPSPRTSGRAFNGGTAVRLLWGPVLPREEEEQQEQEQLKARRETISER